MATSLIEEIKRVNLNEASFSNTGGTGERHASKYFTGESHKTLSRNHGLFKAGDKLHVIGHVKTDKGYHAIVDHYNQHHLIPFSAFQKEKTKNPEQAEQGHMKHFQDEIERVKKETGKDHVVMKFGKHTIHATHIEKVKGTPKADFKIVDKNGNHLYLSHKDGTTHKDFQQLGGVSHETAKNHYAVKALANHIKSKYENERLSGTVAKKLDRSNAEDNQLLHRAVFGHDYGSKEHGINNVHGLVQGHMNLVRHQGDVHELQAHHIIHHGELPHDFQGEIQARYNSDRNDLGLDKTRVTIGIQGNRKVKEYV